VECELQNSAREAGACIHRPDDIRLHTIRKSRILYESHSLGIAPHPPDSPYLALSDLFLFGGLKHCPKEISFSPKEELLLEIDKILGQISWVTLLMKFRNWMKE
jgi:hypothetical protein